MKEKTIISSTNTLLHRCLDRFSEEAKDSKKVITVITTSGY